MTQLEKYPLQDGFETTLSQAWNGATGTIYVNTVPTFTFPSGVTTYIVVNPGKSNMQVAEINAYDESAKTITVNSISLNKGASLAYTAQAHTVGSVVRISDSYQFREDIYNAVNSKVSTNSEDTDTGKFANASARDAYFTSPVNGNTAYLTDTGVRTDYIGGAWSNRATGSTPNGSTTVAGKYEESTQAQHDAGTATGETGADLVSTPTVIQAGIQKGSALYAGASAEGDDDYVVTMTPTLTAYVTGMNISFKADVANTGACTIDVDGLGVKSIKLLDGSTPNDGSIAINQLVELKYDGTDFILQNATDIVTNTANIATNTESISNHGLSQVLATGTLTFDDEAQTNVTITHALGVAPKMMQFNRLNSASQYPSSRCDNDGTITSLAYYNLTGDIREVTTNETIATYKDGTNQGDWRVSSVSSTEVVLAYTIVTDGGSRSPTTLDGYVTLSA